MKLPLYMRQGGSRNLDFVKKTQEKPDFQTLAPFGPNKIPTQPEVRKLRQRILASGKMIRKLKTGRLR